MAIKVNLVMDQGATFTSTFTMTDDNEEIIDMSTYTMSAKMKKSETSSNSFSFSVSGANTGVVTMGMSANTTNSISAGRYLYDVKAVALDGTVSRLVEGIITVTPRIT